MARKCREVMEVEAAMLEGHLGSIPSLVTDLCDSEQVTLLPQFPQYVKRFFK